MSPKEPDVTVIVIAHDVRDEVLACLASVDEHASPVKAEVVLVDNASRDGTADAVAEAFPKTEVVTLAATSAWLPATPGSGAPGGACGCSSTAMRA